MIFFDISVCLLLSCFMFWWGEGALEDSMESELDPNQKQTTQSNEAVVKIVKETAPDL